MAEYIDREAVMNAFAQRVKQSNNSDFAWPPTWNSAVSIVEQFPAADVAEVVRCNDCVWWEDHWPPQSEHRGRHYCANIALSTVKDFYCAFGEKRQESEDEEADE